MSETETGTEEFRVVVIGASAGGFTAIQQILSTLPSDFPGAILTVVHGAFDTRGFLLSSLNRLTGLPVALAENDLEILPGHVYLSVPGKHLVVQDGHIALTNGPRENLFRPAIDVLFRSAAVAYGNRTIGILLTGRLNDGAAGLEAIGQCGGTVMIQDPDSAEFPEMPKYALHAVEADYVLDIKGLTAKLQCLVKEKPVNSVSIPQHLVRENQLSWEISSQISTEDQLGEQVPITCPSCGGPLWKLDDEHTGMPRYRCHVGHAFSQEALQNGQQESLDKALWISLRTLEERHNLFDKMKLDLKEKGLDKMAASYDGKIAEVGENIRTIRRILRILEK